MVAGLAVVLALAASGCAVHGPFGDKAGGVPGGTVVLTLADVSTRAGASWGSRGTIVFVRQPAEIASVSEAGGPITTVLARPRGGSWPFFLTDGRHFLYYRGGDDRARGAYVGTLGSVETKRIAESDYKAAYAPGYLLFVQGDALVAQRFDLGRLEVTGAPHVLAEGI